VTGATGCVGRSLVRRLAEGGCKVNALCRGTTKFQSLFSKIPATTLRLIEGSLESPDALRAATEGVDVVFHAAAKVHSIPRNREEEEEFFRVNVGGTENLLRACEKRALSAFIFFSTIAVYGPNAPNPLQEILPCLPEGAYAKSKYEAERRVLESFTKNVMPATVLRLSLVYGEGERGNFQRMIRGIDRHRFVFVGNKHCQKSMAYVENAVEAALLAAGNSLARGEVFNVADPSPHPMQLVVETVARELKVSVPVLQVPASMMRIGGGVLDLIGRVLHFRPPFSARDIAKLTYIPFVTYQKFNRLWGFNCRSNSAKACDARSSGIVRNNQISCGNPNLCFGSSFRQVC
jgi:nucleoside-diphosphate-sugar epimerase